MPVHMRNLIAGNWIEASGRATFEIRDPATDEPVASVPLCGATEAVLAVDAAAEAAAGWRQRPALERSSIVRRWGDLVLAHTNELADVLTREQGKPLAEARGEIAYAASFLAGAADLAPHFGGDVIPGPAASKHIFVLRPPVGVVAAITPWNFPAAMITRKLGPALAVGCTAVVKPAEQAPLTGLALARLAGEAGVPAGVLNAITGDAAAIGRAWLGDARVRKLSFTGSTAVGRVLIRQAAEHITRLSLELGGLAPFVVFEDADLAAAVRGAMLAKFRNAGQTCICPNRFYVQRSIYEEFLGRLHHALGELRLGHGLDAGVTTGPLIDDDAVAKVRMHIADARDRGASLRKGGDFVRPSATLSGRFCTPTLLSGLTPEMAIAREETFGPVAAVGIFDDEAEAFALANASPYGLAAYAYTRDLARAMRAAEAIEAGIVGINDGGVSTAVAPFGGLKESGWGREGGRWALEAYTDVKYVSIA